MKTKEQAIHEFWNSFGIKGYDETDVPSNVTYPYLTYTNPTDSLGNVVSINVNLWYRDTSWRNASLKKDELARRIIGPDNPTVKFDEGRIYFAGGTPFAQRVDDDDPAIKRYYINVTAEFLCQY